MVRGNKGRLEAYTVYDEKLAEMMVYAIKRARESCVATTWSTRVAG